MGITVLNIVINMMLLVITTILRSKDFFKKIRICRKSNNYSKQ